MENFSLNNVVRLGGVVSQSPVLSHEIYDEKFYKVFIDVLRLSGQYDTLPIIVSEKVVDLNNLTNGTSVLIKGQFRSYNQPRNINNKLVLSIFVKEIEFKELKEIELLNEIVLEGFLCKKPVYRKTPLGREISDVIIAVNRTYKKSDYIPCILWGRNAKFSENMEIGEKVKITGRIQSRKYEKKISDTESVSKVAYEISVSIFSKAKENEELSTLNNYNSINKEEE